MGILLDNFQSEMKHLTESELSVFVNIDNKPEILLTSNLTQTASLLFSSNSTLIRLAQKLGFSGFSDFRTEVRRLTEITKYGTSSELLVQYQEFFTDILPNINFDKLTYFAEKIHEAHTVFIVGVGLTKPIAEYMARYLYQLDRTSIYVYESNMLDLMPNLMQHGDLVLFISDSGETKSLLNCASKVAHTGATLLSFTNSQHNTLNHVTHMSLQSRMPDNFYHNYDVTSRVFLMAMIDLVLDIYMTKYLKTPE